MLTALKKNALKRKNKIYLYKLLVLYQIYIKNIGNFGHLLYFLGIFCHSGRGLRAYADKADKAQGGGITSPASWG